MCLFFLQRLPKQTLKIFLFRVSQASKRQPGTSGRLHRTVTGEWVWSSEEEGGESSDDEVRCAKILIETVSCPVSGYLFVVVERTKSCEFEREIKWCLNFVPSCCRKVIMKRCFLFIQHDKIQAWTLEHLYFLLFPVPFLMFCDGAERSTFSGCVSSSCELQYKVRWEISRPAIPNTMS